MSLVKSFRKRPVVIQAIQFTENDYSVNKILDWMEFDTKPGKIGYYHTDDAGGYIIIPTLEGNHRADIGDWIIRGIKGEFYPCKPDIFAVTYELVE